MTCRGVEHGLTLFRRVRPRAHAMPPFARCTDASASEHTLEDVRTSFRRSCPVA
ncbi:hypothetical protein LF41_3011 [Lysobacter dokdonensis DS-58]|uniref:Uncharacterized protein n=1 Tax=Lysobacter dokdonensis DS-58 TaxID=1300345 RepID=A0A0A2WGP7_9GAMM|nr:hypothetical protein LF41_3011 [Lysobacter dokdonensis DS-58]